MLLLSIIHPNDEVPEDIFLSFDPNAWKICKDRELFKDCSFDLKFIVDSKTKYHSRMICNSPSIDKALNNWVGILEEDAIPPSFTFSSNKFKKILCRT